MANKADLINKVFETYGGEGEDIATKAEAGRVVSAVLDTMSDIISNGEDLMLVGLGTFAVKERAARTYKTPQGKKIKKKKCHYIKFRPSSNVKSTLK